MTVPHGPEGDDPVLTSLALGDADTAGVQVDVVLVGDELAAAGEAIGLGGQEIERTIASGLREGLRPPRAAPHRLRPGGYATHEG